MYKYFFILVLFSIGFTSCNEEKIDVINIGYIGPLSTRATDLGIGPSKAMQLAVAEYNKNRKENEPKVNLFIEDDRWEKEEAIPTYQRLRNQHNIDVLFISNTDGTVAVQEMLIKDQVICINPLNSDELLSSLNINTFKIAKRTEEANGLVAVRAAELGMKNVAIFNYPNDFMTRGANAAKNYLDEYGIQNKIITTEKDQTDYTEEIMEFHKSGVDAYMFFGYKNYGLAMKKIRELGSDAKFFGSTTLMVPEYYELSEGHIVGTEVCFFSPSDGNYILATEFLEDYKNMHKELPFSVWPPMQAYDAMNIVLHCIRKVNIEKKTDEHFCDWLRKSLHEVTYHQGVCGNLSIGPDGASKGIYFNIYRITGKGEIQKVNR